VYLEKSFYFQHNNNVEINDEDVNSTINEENIVGPLSVEVYESGYEILLACSNK